MTHVLRALLVTFLVSVTQAAAAPVPVPPPGPSVEVLRQIEARRNVLRQFELFDIDRLPEADRIETLRKMEPALKDLEAALTSKDRLVFTEVVRDLMNGNYRAFPKDRMLPLLLPRLKTPETDVDRMVSQSFLMEHLARWYGPKARAALPDLLAMVADDNVKTYTRGQAIDTVVRIAPGDEAVIKVFITALNNPNPQSESGVHDRIANHLGDMGKAAAAAKPALVKQLSRREWYQDPAFIALGKIGREDPARPLAEYLAQLKKLDALSAEQIAVAFLHVTASVKTGAKHWVGKPPREEEILNLDAAKLVRPALLTIVEEQKDGIYSRAALRALAELGPGSSPRAAKTLANLVVRTGSSLAVEALKRLEPTDTEAVTPLVAAFTKVEPGDSWHIPKAIAESLAQYGKAARPAAPAIMKALRGFRASPNPGDAYLEQFATYLSVLMTIGGDEPGVRRLVIDLLDPASDVLKRSGALAGPDYHRHLLVALANLGLPADGEERKLALSRVRDGLASESSTVFSAAAQVVIAAKPLTPEEARPMVPLLTRVLAPAFKFKNAQPHAYEQPFSGVKMALRALGSLGSQARNAMAPVKALAERPFEERKSDYLPEPAINTVIREARKTAAAIQ